MYLNPVSKELGVHYMVELYPAAKPDDRTVSIKGYDETRYYKRVWHSCAKNSIDLEKSKEEALRYEETYEADLPEGALVNVRVWTVVDGHLVANTALAFNASKRQSNVIAKPPRSAFLEPPTSPIAKQIVSTPAASDLDLQAPFEVKGLAERTRSLSNIAYVHKVMRKTRSLGNKLHKQRNVESKENLGFHHDEDDFII